jgi:hypothetical protein
MTVYQKYRIRPKSVTIYIYCKEGKTQEMERGREREREWGDNKSKALSDPTYQMDGLEASGEVDEV